MKTKMRLQHIVLFCVGFFPITLMAQDRNIPNWRPYDKTGINVFEGAKDTSTYFDGIKPRIGAGFTMQFQNLKHENPTALNNTVGSYSSSTGSVAGNKLKDITAGFQTAQANLYFDVPLAPGITMNLTLYLSSKHHNETWVKGGYIQIDRLPFRNEVLDGIMKYATIKVGHMEVDYGDAHYRRSDGGQTLYNPFMESNIMDAFATEIGAEVYLKHNGLFGMVGVTNGMIKGNVDSLYNKNNADGKLHKSPSLLAKVGFDKKLAEKFRLRASLSYYGNQSSGSNTLYGGDRSGSNYQYVMEEASSNPSNTSGAGTPLAFSGRFNPGFTKKINAGMFNVFAKYSGFEVFGTYEKSSGRSASEAKTRDASQYAVDAVYRFFPKENVFLGVRYNEVTARPANSTAGTGAGAITYTQDVKINRVALAAGWFVTNNILMKGEYVVQKYKDFPTADYRSGGKFNGYVIEAVVGF